MFPKQPHALPTIPRDSLVSLCGQNQQHCPSQALDKQIPALDVQSSAPSHHQPEHPTPPCAKSWLYLVWESAKPRRGHEAGAWAQTGSQEPLQGLSRMSKGTSRWQGELGVTPGGQSSASSRWSVPHTAPFLGGWDKQELIPESPSSELRAGAACRGLGKAQSTCSVLEEEMSSSLQAM